MKKIYHASYHRDNSGNLYESYAGLLRDCFRQLNDIGQDVYIRDAQKVKFLICGIKAKNSLMTIGKVYLMNYNTTGGMATDFKKAISYLKNCVSTSRNTHSNLSVVDTDL